MLIFNMLLLGASTMHMQSLSFYGINLKKSFPQDKFFKEK
jgi:hypothetical protein